jgi:hypothetical protein
MNSVREAFNTQDSPDWTFKIKWDADFKLSMGRSSRSYVIEFREPIHLTKLMAILRSVEAELINAFDN